MRFGLERTIRDQVAEQLAQLDGLQVPGGGIALGPGELEQLVDQVIETVRFLADSRQGRLAVGAGFGQLDGEAKPGQRGSQLVGDVLKQPAFRREQGRDLIGHEVESPRQFADLVLA